MSDQANKYMLGTGQQQLSGQQNAFVNSRMARVWVAHKNDADAKGEILGVFSSQALADVFKAGADAGAAGGYNTVEIVEMPIQWPA